MLTDPGKFTRRSVHRKLGPRISRRQGPLVGALLLVGFRHVSSLSGPILTEFRPEGCPGTNNLNFPLDIPLHSRFGSITETHVFSNTLINEFRFGINIISDKLNNEAPITGADIGINLPTA